MSDFKYKITHEDLGLEVRDIIKMKFNFSSRLRNKIKKNKTIYLNNEPVNVWTKPQLNDVVTIILPDEKSNFKPQDIPIFPVYEDDNLLIINKQAGLIVHPTKGHPTGTLSNAIANYMVETSQKFKIRFVNRLDMDTSGLIIISKDAYSQNQIINQMQANQTQKGYTAIVNGIIPSDSGTINLPIGKSLDDEIKRAVREDGSPSITHYKVIKRFDKSKYTLVELLLETGRTHQIRVHLSHLGFPILGDWLYNGDNPFLIERQALHASYLKMTHPITNRELTITAPLPDDIKNVLEKIK